MKLRWFTIYPNGSNTSIEMVINYKGIAYNIKILPAENDFQNSDWMNKINIQDFTGKMLGKLFS